MKVPVNKGMLLSEVSLATVRKCKSNVKEVWVGETCITCGSTCMV